jgi:hypothetical protein
MLSLILFIHFIYGSFLPLFINKLVAAFNNFEGLHDVLNNGFVDQEQYNFEATKVIVAILFLGLFVFGYGCLIKISLNVL